MSSSKGALDGVKIIDLSLLYPGPLCSQFLADLGAEVVKVENPRAPDMSRYLGKKNGDEMSSYFAQWNRNKQSLTLNLKRDEGKSIFKKLLAQADVLIEGFRPSAMKKLGLDYQSLKEEFPKLIYCSISGYGNDSSLSDHAGHDANYIAKAGVLSINGSGLMPEVPAFQLADNGGGSYVALSSILAALYQREKTGEGQYIEVAMADGALSFMSLYFADYAATLDKKDLPQRGNLNLSGALPNYRIYRLKDQSFVVLAALEKIFFSSFLNQIERTELLELINFNSYNMSDQDSRSIEKCHRELEEFFAQKNKEDLSEVFNNPNACLSKIESAKNIFHDQYFYQRNMILDAVSPTQKKYKLINSPFKLSKSPLRYKNFAPSLGQDNKIILNQLGYNDEEIFGLKEKNIV